MLSTLIRQVIRNFVFFAMITSCSGLNKANLIPKENDLFRINKIKEKPFGYVIYASRNDTNYMILSDNNPEIINIGEEQLTVGKYYNLMIYKIFPPDSIFGYKMIPNYNISLSVDRVYSIRPSQKYNYEIYKAHNLNGIILRAPQNN